MRKFPQSWIGRGGWKALSPHSHGLTPLDFGVWGYVKTPVDRIPSVKHLKQQIRSVVESVAPKFLIEVSALWS